MTGFLPHHPKVVHGPDNALTENPAPHSVHHDPRSERIFRGRQIPCEGKPCACAGRISVHSTDHLEVASLRRLPRSIWRSPALHWCIKSRSLLGQSRRPLEIWERFLQPAVVCRQAFERHWKRLHTVAYESLGKQPVQQRHLLGQCLVLQPVVHSLFAHLLPTGCPILLGFLSVLSRRKQQRRL